MDSGADKVAINTAVVKNKCLISKIVKIFNVRTNSSINAKEFQIKNGKFILIKVKRTGLDALKWAQTAENLGAEYI